MESPQTEVPGGGGVGDDEEETEGQEEGQAKEKDDPNQKKQSQGLRGSPSSLLREENERRATLEKARSKQLEKFDEIRAERLSRLTGGPPPPPRKPPGPADPAAAPATPKDKEKAPKEKEKAKDKEKDRGDKAGGKSKAEKDVADVLTEIAVAAGAAPGAGQPGAAGASSASGAAAGTTPGVALTSAGERLSLSMAVRPSQQHLVREPRGQGSRQFSLLSTRRGSGGESLRGPRYAPTYRMTCKNPFKAWKVYKVLKELLEFECEPKRRYDPAWAAKRCVDLAKDVRGAIRMKSIDRYKFCVKVDIGQKLDEGVCSMARFMWDVDKDDFAFHTCENTYMFIIVSVYAFYYD